jgi:carboxyl-terminal processing protease
MKPVNRNSYTTLLLVILTAFVVTMASSVYGDFYKNDTYETLRLFSDVLEEIEKNYVENVEAKELIEKAIHGMMKGLDPHSAFLPPEAFEGLQDDTRGEFGGIGIVISMQNDRLTVISPMEGTPAFRAGVKANDVIIKVGDESTRDMMLWEAVKLMRGKPGTAVNITVVREGVEKPIEFALKREIIPLESVRYTTPVKGYGYLWITNFREKTTDEVRNAIASLEADNGSLKGLILDLRDNPGGLLSQAVSVSDMFLETGDIVSIRGRDDKEMEVYKAGKSGKDKYEFPIVVLINSGSASAAEIVAGALQDNNRALIIGTASFGKGSVQTVRPLRSGYALKYTIAKYYTPDGTSIQATGIQPDLIVQRRLLDESEGGLDARRLREEDLEDHLPGINEEEKPDFWKDKDDKEEEKLGEDAQFEKLMRLRDVVYDHDDRDPRVLLLDSQINRAYEILRGHELFSAFRNSSSNN